MNNNQIQGTKGMTMSNFLAMPNVARMLDENLGTSKKQFTSDLLALSSDKNIANCDPSDVLKCAMNATAIGLPLNKNLGYAYVIAYGGNPQFQIGYKGIVQLALRSGKYKIINVCDVREGEMKRNKFTGEVEFLEEQPQNEIIGYLAYLKLINGFEQSLYMTLKEINEHRDKHSKSGRGGKGIWKDEYDQMSKKTVLKLLLNRWGILSLEMQTAIEKDQTDANGNYNDNIKKANAEELEIVSEQEEAEKKEVQNEINNLFANMGKITNKKPIDLFKEYGIKGGEDLKTLEEFKIKIENDLIQIEADATLENQINGEEI